jgi:hypothetical protein
MAGRCDSSTLSGMDSDIFIFIALQAAAIVGLAAILAMLWLFHSETPELDS